ncbi:MAG: hypothetical protein NUV51_09000 [Sulfuricaulis sp.]|nr:hypothetical protein [Sulfuricaulis sp.]
MAKIDGRRLINNLEAGHGHGGSKSIIAGNSRYWYSGTTHSYDDFADAKKELVAIKREIESGR